MQQWLRSSPLPTIWPADRYEVRSTRPAPDFTTVDRYHFAEFAHEAAEGVQAAGLATQVVVVRLEDGIVLFEQGMTVPLEAW
ncbi:hypothetical protein Aple_097740 [Acrocarpospora pleiomorpha]|uniref:Uncharacterized protein n=1 Tax=Acrocarpospora pleiomorpha TaxID=90975 RepID=A0A5M3Y0K7_9ACTN|nr:hypothetical protein [Acrocarpospora pleiomorpha]GES26875.1 hypothetical protein Aple_097740 [Acrocarpospora pleiomorpha]